MSNVDEGSKTLNTPQRGKWASRMPPGCILKPTLVAIILLSGGVVLINRSEKLGGPGRFAAVLLIFLGALFSIPVLLIAFGLVARWYFHRRLNHELKDVLEPARASIERNKVLYSELQEYRDATEAEFAPLDRDWYEAQTRELESSGHRRLGDVINQTIERAAGVAPVIRRMISADGTTMPCFFHLVLPAGRGRPHPRDFRTIDLETEFTDGTFLITSNSLESDLTTPPPAIQRQRYPASTPVSELLHHHETEKAAVLASKQGASCVQISTAQEGMEFQHRQQLIKAVFQKGMGHVDLEMIRRVAKQTMPEDEAGQALAVAAADIARRQAALKG